MRLHQALVAAIAALAIAANAEPLYVESGGVVVIEAEGYSNKIDRVISATNFEWQTNNTQPGFSGTGYVEATPNNGVNQNVNWLNTSPELEYAVNFSEVGTHYVWLRMYAENGTDDSAHSGLRIAGNPGWTNTASDVTLLSSQLNAWSWTTNRTLAGAPRPRVIVNSTGVQSFSLWMREDGVRIDRIILTTNINFSAQLGNAWHIPDNFETNITMRSPLGGMAPHETVFLYTGNQFQGSGGNPGTQIETGSAIFYKHVASNSWNTVPMFFWYQRGNNKYFSNSIPPNTFMAGDTVQYYFRIPYSDHITTFVGGNNTKYELEADAQANPFEYDVQWLAQPSGSFAYTGQGSASDQVHARIYNGSGHIEILREAFEGSITELGATNVFLPSWALVNGNSYIIGPVLSVSNMLSGIEVRQAFGHTSIVARLTFPLDHIVRYEVLDWGGPTPKSTAVAALSDANEHFYGFGEKFNSFDQAGKRVRMITDDPPGSPKGDRSYKVVPWFISTRGYGFHLDSSAESFFDMRAAASDRYFVDNLFGTLKFNIVVGPKLTDVLTRFTGYTGRPQMSPPWAYAPWMSSDRWGTGGEVRYVITKYREQGIPGSVFVFDSPWEIGYNDYTWNIGSGKQFSNDGIYESVHYDGFSSVTDLMTFLRTNGWKVICWMTPFINTNSTCCGEVPGQNLGQSANYAEGAANNYFVRASFGGPPLVTNWWKGTGSPVDYTNPGARQWISTQLSNFVNVSKSGGFPVIGGFKTDDGESGNPPGTYIPKTAAYFDGRTGQEMQNGYATEYHKTIWSVLGTNGLLFARSGFTGSHAYSGYWAGDNYPNYAQDNGLQSVIVAAGSAAMSGYSTWSSDIGGYQNTSFETDRADLFRRWTQFGAFSPLMQMHRQVNGSNLEQFPWGYGAFSLTNYQLYAKLHTALFPYIYSYAVESSTNGLPIIRPLVLLNQSDPGVYGINHTYMFGNELLVAPVNAANATTRNVYMPAGVWYDFFTNQRYVGSSNVVWNNSNQMQMPLFVRDGGIIPMISTNVQTLCDAAYVSNPNLVTMDNSLQFLIYPAENSSFTVYDGTSLQCQSNGTVVTATLFSNVRPILMRFRAAQPFGVERDGVRLPKFTSAAGFEASGFGWFYDGSGFVNVKFDHAGGTAKIMFGPDSVGDGITDSWRTNFFGSATTTNDQSCVTCDADGDGQTNAQEYGAGTNPGNAGSALRVQTLTSGGSGVTVTWPTEKGIPYRVLWKDEMSTIVPWQTNNLDSFVGDGTVFNWLDNGTVTGIPPTSLAVDKRFYKVIVP